MKKIKVLSFILLFLLIFSIGTATVYADMGPKPASFITIKGIEGDYVACFAAKKASGPNFDYEDWLENSDWFGIEYNPIMEYKDAEGYKWITHYYECNGETEIKFTYYCPDDYKIVIYQNDEFYIATESLTRYAFSTYYEIDFSNGTITKTYDYFGETLNLIFRLAVTLIIEIGLFFLLRLYTKRNLLVVVIVNLITQIFLNVMVNLTIYNSGALSAILLLFKLEFLILIIEFIIYQIFLKEKKRWLIIIYPLIANILSFGIGYFLLRLM